MMLGLDVLLGGCAHDPASTLPRDRPSVIDTRFDGLKSAVGIDDPTPRLSWMSTSPRRGATQSAYELRVVESSTGQPAWASGVVASPEQIGIRYAGAWLKPQAIYQWQVRIRDDAGSWSAWSAPSSFEMGLGAGTSWPARWITGGAHAASLPLLRRRFTTDKPVLRARLYATARGVYQFRLNGHAVGDQHLAPGWTDYNKRLDYQVYDVTTQLQAGDNTLAAMLAPGWYAGQIAIFGTHKYGVEPSLLARLRLDFADGSSQWIDSDEHWQSKAGPMLLADNIEGEDYDARLLPPGWDAAGDHGDGWGPVKILAAPRASLQAQADQPVRTTELRDARWLERQPTHGAALYDMGQVMVGVVRVRMTGRAGQTVRIRYGEMLNPDGSLYTANLRKARATDHYTFASDGTVTWAPDFTFHDFRYVEIQGLDRAPDAGDVKGEVWGSDLPMTAEWSSSNAMLNQLMSNIRWTLRGNVLSIPADSMRDERLGWLGDVGIFAPTATKLVDADAFLAKWLRDVRDAQLPDGDYQGVAPTPMPMDGGSGWSDAGIIVPHALWLAYGDTQPISDGWDSMQRFMVFEQTLAGPGLRPKHGPYGDWLHLDDPTSPEFLGTAYLAYDAKLMARMARALGKLDDARHYDDLATRAETAFNDAYFKAGRSSSDSQSSYALALGLGLVPESQVQPMSDRLAGRVHARKDHLSTGFLGTPWLLDGLERGGHRELAYKLLTATDYPSWGYEVKSGATTLWERWNSLQPDGAFGNVEMNGFNQTPYGSVGDWMLRRVGGIAPAAPGYRLIAIAPLPGGGLSSAHMRQDSPYGEITSDWKLVDGHMEGSFTVPFNARAVVTLPAATPDGITLEGRPLASSAASAVTCDTRGVHLQVGSGHWTYRVDVLRP